MIGLLDRGWTLVCEPGHPIHARSGENRFSPFEDIHALWHQALTPED